MPNVKAGDLAIVKNAKPKYNGLILEVISSAPSGSFYLPDGTWHGHPSEQPSWIVKSLSGKILCPWTDGVLRPVLYGVAADRFLFPLPGDEKEAEEPCFAENGTGCHSADEMRK